VSLRPTIGLVAVAILVGAKSHGQEQGRVFRSDVRSVSVDVSVRQANLPVAGLSAEEFVVYDQGVRQKIDSVSLGAVPIDVTLFLGTGGWLTDQIGRLNDDLRTIAGLLRPDDRLRVLTFDDQVRDVAGWQHAGPNFTWPEIRRGNSEAIYDALFLSLMRRPDPDRRHLIVAVTDGIDAGSVVSSTTVLNAAERAESVLHLAIVNILFGAPRMDSTILRTTWWRVLPDTYGISTLQEAARVTGGAAATGASGGSLVRTFQTAFDDFRLSYLLRFTPAGVSPAGWHDLRVDLAKNQNFTIRARRRYFGG
jgi:VWFA-related protein